MDEGVEDAAGAGGPGPPPAPRPVFAHPQWSVGVVLVFAVVAIVAGFSSPVWWIVGGPFILTLGVYVVVRVLAPTRRAADEDDREG